MDNYKLLKIDAQVEALSLTSDFHFDLSCSCDGRCMRSFHATEENDDECLSLGLSKEEVDVCNIILFLFYMLAYSL